MRETFDLEYKQRFTKTCLKTVSAYANYGSGRVIFGIDDDGNAVGLDENPEKVCLQIENAINDSLSPVPRFELSIDENRRLVTLAVYEGESKPYLCSGKAYRRADSSTVEVDRSELARLILEGSHMTFDALESARQEFTFDYLESELVRKMGITKLDENALISLELKSPQGAYNNAAALLADTNQFLGIDIARFGENTNIILSRRMFEKQSVLAQLRGAMEAFDDYYTYEEIVGFERVQRESIPREAFRETIANALVHRCWDVNANINIRMFADRIEVTSPGGLPDGTTEEAYLAGGVSVVRNPIVANVFFRLGHIERFGTGIPRIREAYGSLDVSPRFIIRNSTVTVVLPTEAAAGLSVDERKVLEALPKNVMRSRAEIELSAGMSKGRVLRVLSDLTEKGVVRKVGAGRSVRYSR